MTQRRYRATSDPGHGWLHVKRAELVDLGIAADITAYSYQRGQTVYLEEDCDATTFARAYEARHGHKPLIDFHSTDRNAAIRSYDSYTPEVPA